MSYINKDKKYSYKDIMLSFLQGAIYQWILMYKDKENPSFIIRDILGGFNADWNNTPLQYLFEYYRSVYNDKEKASKLAADDAGWLLKEIIENDNRVEFDNSKKDFYSTRYTFIRKK